MYINEIIVRLYQSHEADPVFFQAYESTLQELAAGEAIEPVLRQFELRMLDILGYGIDFSAEGNSHDPITGEKLYYFQETSGFNAVSGDDSRKEEAGIFQGTDLLAIHQGDFSSPGARQAAKHLIREILNNHLGSRPLRSRSLFRSL